MKFRPLEHDNDAFKATCREGAPALAAGGEPSTRFPPEGLVETAANIKCSEKS